MLVAQEMDCGNPPPVANEELRIDIEGNAKLLTGLLGQAAVSGKVQKSRSDIFASYPNADKVVVDRYLLYQICVYLRDDPSLTNSRKIQKLYETRQIFIGPVPVLTGGGQARRYWYRLYDQAFTCDLEMPISRTEQESTNREPFTGGNPFGFNAGLAMANIQTWLPRAIFHRGEMMKFYSCSFDAEGSYYECMMRFKYKNSAGEKCAKFECETNVPSIKEFKQTYSKYFGLQDILCENNDGILVNPTSWWNRKREQPDIKNSR